jgi:hypothetical protein
MIWQKAQELYQMEQAKTMGEDFKGITAERRELWEGGYFYQAKLIVLRNLWLEKKGLQCIEEEETMHRPVKNEILTREGKPKDTNTPKKDHHNHQVLDF